MTAAGLAQALKAEAAKVAAEEKQNQKPAEGKPDEEDSEEPEDLVKRNPKLAHMMQMMHGGSNHGGELFAGQPMTPEVPRTTKAASKMSEAEDVVHEAAEKGIIDKDVDDAMKLSNRPTKH